MSSTRLRWAACLFGFGLGGFFDGIPVRARAELAQPEHRGASSSAS